MYLENAGMPTVTIITQAFRIPAASRSTSLGHPDLAVVAMAHPLASKTPEQVAADTDAVLDSVIAALLGGAGS